MLLGESLQFWEKLNNEWRGSLLIDTLVFRLTQNKFLRVHLWCKTPCLFATVMASRGRMGILSMRLWQRQTCCCSFRDGPRFLKEKLHKSPILIAHQKDKLAPHQNACHFHSSTPDFTRTKCAVTRGRTAEPLRRWRDKSFDAFIFIEFNSVKLCNHYFIKLIQFIQWHYTRWQLSTTFFSMSVRFYYYEV